MVFIVVEVMVAEVAVLTGVALIVSVVVAVVVDFLRRFFSMPRGRKRLAVLATGFR